MGKWISRTQITGTPYTIIVFASRFQGNREELVIVVCVGVTI